MGGMVTASRSELWGAMWTFQDHGSTHEAEFGRERPPGYRWLPHIQPSPVAAARSIWKRPCAPDRCPQAGRLRGVGLRPRESRLNVDREREPTARRAQRQAQCNLVQLRHQLEPSDPTPNASEM
jgi:hypothetical protein